MSINPLIHLIALIFGYFGWLALLFLHRSKRWMHVLYISGAAAYGVLILVSPFSRSVLIYILFLVMASVIVLYRADNPSERLRFGALAIIGAMIYIIWSEEGLKDVYNPQTGHVSQWVLSSSNSAFLYLVQFFHIDWQTQLIEKTIPVLFRVQYNFYKFYFLFFVTLYLLTILFIHHRMNLRCGRASNFYTLLQRLHAPKYGWLVALILAAASVLLPPDQRGMPALVIHYSREIVFGFYAAGGLLLTVGLIGRQKFWNYFLLTFIAFLFVWPQMIYVMILLALLDNAVGFHWLLFSPDEMPKELVAPPKMTYWRFIFSMFAFLVLGAGSYFLLFHIIESKSAAAPAPQQVVRQERQVIFEFYNRRLYMDRYPYPNIKGSEPLTGVTYQQAAKICAKQGKRLCTDEEWMSACQHSPTGKYLNAGFGKNLPDRTSDAIKACYPNEERGQPWPLGARPQCINWHGVEDLVGGVWQWVATPQRQFDGFRLLKGCSYRHNDDTRPACRYEYWVHDSQIDRVSPDDIGFRCCRSKDVLEY